MWGKQKKYWKKFMNQFKVGDNLEILKNEPDLIKINQAHKPNEGYSKSLKEDDEFIRKSGS